VCLSYAIQAGLVLLFQFPFVVFYYYSPSTRRRVLVDMYEGFFKVYALFNISFLIATLIVHVQPGGLIYGYEFVFLVYLLQAIAIGVCAVTATPLIIKLLEVFVVGDRPDEFRWQITPKKRLVFGLVYAVNFACAVYETFQPRSRTGFETQYPRIEPFCPQYADAVPPARRWTNYIWLTTSVVMLLSIVPVRMLHRRVRGGKGVPKRKVVVAWLVLLVVLGVLMSAMLGYLMHRVITLRRRLEAVVETTPDDDWGFGQLLALFIWVDPILKMGQNLFKFAWHRLGPRDVREKSKASRERAEQREHLHNYMQQYPQYQPDVELAVQRPPTTGGGSGGGKLDTAATWNTAQYTIVTEAGGGYGYGYGHGGDPK